MGLKGEEEEARAGNLVWARHTVATGAAAFVRAMVRWAVYMLLLPLFSPASSMLVCLIGRSQLAARKQRCPGDSLSRSAS